MPHQLIDAMVTSEVGPCCPHCRAPVHRIPRTVGDRLLSLFRRVYRFRCDALGCGWEGTLLAPHAGSSASYRSRKIRS